MRHDEALDVAIPSHGFLGWTTPGRGWTVYGGFRATSREYPAALGSDDLEWARGRAWAFAQAMGLEIAPIEDADILLAGGVVNLVIDALFGTGLDRPPREHPGELEGVGGAAAVAEGDERAAALEPPAFLTE